MGKTLIIQQMEVQKKMRIIKCLILFVLQSTTCHLNAQSIKECLKIDSVQTIYDIGSSVSFHFSNNCEENIYISPQFRNIIPCEVLFYIEVTFWALSIDLGIFWSSWFLHRHKIPHPNQ